MKIGMRLSLGFIVLIVGIVIVAIVGINSLNRSGNDLEHIVENRYPKVVASYSAINYLYQATQNLRDIILTRDNTNEERNALMKDASLEITKQMNYLDSVIVEPEGMKILKDCKDTRAEYLVHHKAAIALVEAGKYDSAATVLLAGYEDQKAYIANDLKLVDYQRKKCMN